MLASGKLPSDIGKALNVGLQLEGTVQREGNRLRVTARLVGVSDGVMKWSDMYERNATDLLTVQEELARAITDAVGAAMGGSVALASAPAAADTNRKPASAGYDLYLRGRVQLSRRSPESLKLAVTYFQQAVQKDPNMAPAYSGLADAQGLLPLYTNAPAAATLTAALRSADRAIALDSTLAEAWASRGALQKRVWKWADAEHDLLKAVTLNPRYATAHQWLGELYLVLNRIPEATKALQNAAQLDPASPVIVGSLGVSMALEGRGVDAVTTAERAVSYDSTLLVSRFMLGATHVFLRQPAKAIQPLEAAVRIDPSSRLALGVLGFAYGASGDSTAARRIKARIEAMPYAPGTDVALARIDLALGDSDDAMSRLEHAARAQDPFFATEPSMTPIFDVLRRNPRFLALLRSVGLPMPTIATRSSATVRDGHRVG
jgi:serine/threonine-protein kinase